jgi:hypothetical protein
MPSQHVRRVRSSSSPRISTGNSLRCGGTDPAYHRRSVGCSGQRRSRLPWAHLLRQAILTHLGLSTTTPPIAPARSRAPPEPDLFAAVDEAASGTGPSQFD